MIGMIEDDLEGSGWIREHYEVTTDKFGHLQF